MTVSFILKRTVSYQDIKAVKYNKAIYRSLSHDSLLNKNNDTKSRSNFIKYILTIYLIMIEYSLLVSKSPKFNNIKK
jgi:hypothetical protein